MKSGIQSWKALIKFILYYFSIGGLMRTFFVPWHREQYNAEPGIWGYLEKFVFFLFATIFGMVIRTITIVIGLVVLLLVTLLFPIFALIPIKLKYESLVRNGSLGRDWAYPVTYLLDQHGRDLRKNHEVLVIDHDQAIEQIQRVLSRKTQQNVLITGSQGIGKSTRLGHLARMMHRDLSVPALNGKRLVQLFPEEMNIEDIQKCIKEAIAAKNIVLVIENIERFNIIGTLEPYLDNNHFQMILTTDWGAYNETYKHHQNLMRVSEVVEMYPPDDETTMLYLRDWTYDNRESKRMSNDVLAATVMLTNKLMMNQAQPEKSIDILEELAGLPDKKIEVSHVEKLLSQKTNVPLGSLNRDEKDKLIHLEEVLSSHVIGQSKAIKAIASALKRGRAGVADSPKPIGSFLFLGPTGVGKTHTAKMLAAYYFGGEHMMIRFDMSEYRELESMARFITRLGDQVEEAPFSLVFFDEIEKAHPDILNIFLQLLDEGQIHTQSGRTISFRNAIVICTSNAGATFMMANEHESQEFLINHIVSQGILRPEFINRFDATILYQSLSRDEIKQVTMIMLNKLNKNIMKQHQLEVLITDELVNALARKGHTPQFGVRPLARVIQDYIETEIADVLLLEPVPFNLSLMINPEILED
ncbi:MAG: AAA family ATPase [Candidatus Pacebacteria bacterium]|nr:AAA family ATPase [Candidatus Paceibacterota bacterium]